jgi:hypothetical protein
VKIQEKFSGKPEDQIDKTTIGKVPIPEIQEKLTAETRQ